MSTSSIRILIADDHPLFRDGLRGLFSSVPDMAVVGEAATGDEAVQLAGSPQSDVIVMDIKMPGRNGIEATRDMLAVRPDTHVLMMTMFEDDEFVFAAMRAGASGYLLKGASQAEMLRAIRAVANGEVIFGPGVARRMLGFFAEARPAAAPRAFPELSRREEEVLGLLAQGQSNVEIANRLVISLKTVQNHVSNICGKLRVADRVQAALRGREAGLGK